MLIGCAALTWARRLTDDQSTGRSARPPAILSAAALGAAIALLSTPSDHPAALYFGAGGCLLISGLAAMAAALRRARAPHPRSLAALAWANLTRRPGAVIAATAVLAAGTFVVIGVGVSRHDAKALAGTGGFALLGESTLPVMHRLDTPEGLAAYGLVPEDLKGGSVVPLRVRRGDDASCLNLAQAPRPTLYGVDPQAMDAREAFGSSAWSTLTYQGAPPGDEIVIPAIGDEATLTWRLKLGPGDELSDVDEAGRPYRLRIVGVVPNSILQGGLLIDVSALALRFPTTSADQRFLIDAPREPAVVEATLRDALGDTGFMTTPTEEVLARYLRVENTYLAIFLALGGLGLLLGAPGVGVLLFRQVLARRRELAVLATMGWRRERIRRLIGLEHSAIILFGVGIGGLSALIAVIPALGTSVSRAPAQSAAVLVSAVLLVGLIGVGIATQIALRGPLSGALSDDS